MKEPQSTREATVDHSTNVSAQKIQAAMPNEPRIGMLEFKALAETIPNLVFVTDSDGSNIYTNIVYSRYSGVAPEALLGDGWVCTLHPEDQERAKKLWAECAGSGKAYDVRYRFRRFDGDYRWHVVRGLPLRDARGAIVRWMGTCTDVDDLITSIGSKTNSEAVLNALGHDTGIILYAKDSAGRFIYANDATVETIGLPVEQILGRSTDDFAPGSAQSASIQANNDLALRSADGVIVEENWLAPDGTLRTYRSRKAKLQLADGTIGLAAAMIDVTAEKNLENLLLQSSVRYRSWLDAIPVATFEADRLGRIIGLNQHWLDTCGISVRDEPHALSDLIVQEAQEEFGAEWAACVKHGQPLSLDLPIYDHFEKRVRISRVTAFSGSMLGAPDSDHWYGSFS